MLFACGPCQSTIVCADVGKDKENQQLYLLQTKRTAQDLFCYILLGSKRRQRYWDRSRKLRMKNRQGVTQVVGSS